MAARSCQAGRGTLDRRGERPSMKARSSAAAGRKVMVVMGSSITRPSGLTRSLFVLESAAMKKPGRASLPRRRDPRAAAQRPRRPLERVEPLRRREEDPHHRRLGHRGRAAAAAHDADKRRHAHHPRAQHLARRAVRPLDQPLSRLRARLHLLLRAADPRLSRPVARPRFRDQDPVQARRRQAARPPSSPRPSTGPTWSRWAPTPIPTSRSSASSRSRARS